VRRKLVIVKQRDLKDCGSCCLSSLIQFYGGFVPLEKLRLDTKTSKDGSTAFNLVNAARKYGFDAKGIKINDLNYPQNLLPAIAHLEYQNGLKHFVVLYEIQKKHVIIMDPAKGRVKLLKEDFQKDFTNILILFYPQQKILKLSTDKSIIHYFWQVLGQEKSLFWQIILMSLFLMVTSIITSYYFKIGLDAITNNSNINNLKLIVLIFLVITLFKIIFTYWRSYLENHLNKNLDVLLMSNFINHIFRLPSLNIYSRSSGEIITRINELENIKNICSEFFIASLLDFFLAFASMPILLIINNKLFIVLCMIIFIYFLIGFFSAKTIYVKAYNNIELESVFNQSILENLEALTSLRHLHLPDIAINNIEKRLANFIHDTFQIKNLLNVINWGKLFLNEIGFFIINTLGFYFIYQNTLSISSLITFNTFYSYFLNPLKNLVDSIPKYNFLKATFTKLGDFLSIEEEVLGKKSNILNNNIKVKNLFFSYNDYHEIMKDVNFEIKENSMVMLKGHSGCGKSTFCQILYQELKDYKGEILLGEKNLKDYSLNTIRSNISYVSQHEKIFTDTILNNLVLDREVDDKFLQEVLEICELEKVLQQKKMRLETIIGNDLPFLSGGEKQRIILARALLKKASIFIFDEALSEVDYETERIIIKNIRKYFKNVTILYITHKKQDDLFEKVIFLEV